MFPTGNTVNYTLNNSAFDRWKFCPRDGQQLDPAWTYCPRCSMQIGSLGSIFNATPFFPTFPGGTLVYTDCVPDITTAGWRFTAGATGGLTADDGIQTAI